MLVEFTLVLSSFSYTHGRRKSKMLAVTLLLLTADKLGAV